MASVHKTLSSPLIQKPHCQGVNCPDRQWVMRVKCPFISEKPREVRLGKKKFQSFVVQKQPLGEVVFYHRQFDQTPIDRENGVCREMHSVIQRSVEAWGGREWQGRPSGSLTPSPVNGKGQADVRGGAPSLANRPRAVKLTGPPMTFHRLTAWAPLAASTKLGRFSVSRKIEHNCPLK